ncbi:sialidase family protein [Clostridium thermosuccinogenes]|jgi:predicted neuraminidase|uniref:sialidase family protein n=1 Tax=Clostridium thermosuccinogenes TaxID=84032 RepID=UPI000CCC8C19|nr:sialidase family protein [Pseudoclostridium thermosuccinogenes]PNT91428.1 neuraminidase (sialidase) [Pseudoclostridium thermosuccinogenes]
MYKILIKEKVIKDRKYFKSCHASTLTVLPNGNILSAWFGGTQEGADDVAIWGAVRENDSWSEPFKIADEEGLPHWNPVLFTRGGRVFLFYKVGHEISDWYTRYTVSEDNGKTWSEPVELVKGDRGGRGPVKNKMLVLSNGAWIAPASTEKGMWKAFADISYDDGRTWLRSEDICIDFLKHSPADTDNATVSEQSFLRRGVIQPTLWESEPGKVHMLLRSTEGFIYRSDSEDYGKSWSEAYPTALPNNNSGIDLVRLGNGVLYLAYNPIGENWGPRTPIVLAASSDNGISWKEQLVLDDGPGEFSYPAVISDGEDILITYTWKRENIAFWRISTQV